MFCVCDIVEAHCYFVDIGRTDREQIRSRINNNDCRMFSPRSPLSTAYRTVLYAGRFGHEGLCQLCTQQFCMQLTKALWPKRPAIIVIDSATYLLTIGSVCVFVCHCVHEYSWCVCSALPIQLLGAFSSVCFLCIQCPLVCKHFLVRH